MGGTRCIGVAVRVVLVRVEAVGVVRAPPAHTVPCTAWCDVVAVVRGGALDARAVERAPADEVAHGCVLRAVCVRRARARTARALHTHGRTRVCRAVSVHEALDAHTALCAVRCTRLTVRVVRARLRHHRSTYNNNHHK